MPSYYELMLTSLWISETLQFCFQCCRGIESPEHFSTQPWHQLLQVNVENACVQPVEQLVSPLFVLHEDSQILEHLLVHLNHVFIPHRIFAQEVKLNHTFLVQIQNPKITLKKNTFLPRCRWSVMCSTRREQQPT